MTEGLNDNGERARKKFARECVKKRQKAPKSAKKRFFAVKFDAFLRFRFFAHKCANLRRFAQFHGKKRWSSTCLFHGKKNACLANVYQIDI